VSKSIGEVAKTMWNTLFFWLGLKMLAVDARLTIAGGDTMAAE